MANLGGEESNNEQSSHKAAHNSDALKFLPAAARIVGYPQRTACHLCSRSAAAEKRR